MTSETLSKCMPKARQRDVSEWTVPLSDAMRVFNISTPKRQAAFLANVAHESMELYYKKEIASGAAYDTGSKAASLGNTPEADGDGQKYKGRGPLELTGTANYAAFDKYVREVLQIPGFDFLKNPELIESARWGSLSSAWFWTVLKGLNKYADVDNFREIVRRINGGYTHYNERVAYWNNITQVLKTAA